MNRSAAMGVLFLSVSLPCERATVAGQLQRNADSADETSDVNPFDPNVPRQLTHMKRMVSLGRIHPPTQQVKAA
ncbi:MAG TPA: hypothetical protein VHK01_13085, partial [Lacipirellulaceae bacterium]|nr:hypothetical protein [Lacipirellulaceae bacterium]